MKEATTNFKKQLRPSAADVEKNIFGVANGDPDALKTLYEQVSAPVYAYALSVLRNPYDADDVLHDTVVKVYEKAPTYQPRQKPMAWILTVAKNLCYTKFRQDARVADVSDEELERRFAENPQMSAEDRLVVTKCLGKLASDERSVVVLHAVSGLKHREIAKLLDMPLATVLSKYNRSLKKLKILLTEDD